MSLVGHLLVVLVLMLCVNGAAAPDTTPPRTSSTTTPGQIQNTLLPSSGLIITAASSTSSTTTVTDAPGTSSTITTAPPSSSTSTAAPRTRPTTTPASSTSSTTTATAAPRTSSTTTTESSTSSTTTDAPSTSSTTTPAPRTSSTTTTTTTASSTSSTTTVTAEPVWCNVSRWSLWVPTFFCPGLVGLSSDRYQSTDWCVSTRSRRVIQQPLTQGTCPSLFEDDVAQTCHSGQVNQDGCFSLLVDFDQPVACSSQLNITCLMANCIHMSINPLCWDTVCQLELSIMACMKRHSDCSERDVRSFLPAEYQCLFRSKCQNGSLSQSPCISLTDESYNYGSILGVDLNDCWGLLMIGGSEDEKKTFVLTVYSCIRHKFSEAGLSPSNMRLALDRVQMELSCRQNLTELETLQQLETRAITFMDFRTNRTTVGVYGDPHLRTHQRPQLTTCASEGTQVYLRSRILDISGVNSKLCPESRATFLSQVTFEFKSLLNPDVVTARYDARNGQHPDQIEQLISDVTPVDEVRLEHVNWRRIRLIWDHTGVFIDFSRWGSSYFFTLRVAESVLQGGEGLLVEGCPEDQIIDRNPVLTNMVETCDEVSVTDPLVSVTTSGTRQPSSSGTIPTTTSITPQPLPPDNRTIDATTLVPSEATGPGTQTASMQPNLVTAQEARSACENGSSRVTYDVTLLHGDNLEMCMFDVLVTGDIAYVVMAEEALNSQIEAVEQDPVITSKANIWTFIEEELTTLASPTTSSVTSRPADGCTLDDAKLAGLLALVIVLLFILIILIIIIIILWRRKRSRKHRLEGGRPSPTDYELRPESDNVVDERYSTLLEEEPDKPKKKWSVAPTKNHVGTTLEMSSYSPAENERQADGRVPDKSTFLTVKSNDAKDGDGSNNRGSYIHPTDDHVTSAPIQGETEDGTSGSNGTVDYLHAVRDNDQARDVDDMRESYVTPVPPSNLCIDLLDDKPTNLAPVRAETENNEREDNEIPVRNADTDGTGHAENDYMTPGNDGTVGVAGHVETSDYFRPASDENPYANMGKGSSAPTE